MKKKTYLRHQSKRECGKVCSVRCGLSRYKYPSTIWLAWSSLHAKWHTREHLIAPCPRTAFYMQDGIYKSHQMHQIWTRVVFMIVGTLEGHEVHHIWSLEDHSFLHA